MRSVIVSKRLRKGHLVGFALAACVWSALAGAGLRFESKQLGVMLDYPDGFKLIKNTLPPWAESNPLLFWHDPPDLQFVAPRDPRFARAAAYDAGVWIARLPSNSAVCTSWQEGAKKTAIDGVPFLESYFHEAVPGGGGATVTGKLFTRNLNNSCLAISSARYLKWNESEGADQAKQEKLKRELKPALAQTARETETLARSIRFPPASRWRKHG